MSAGPIAVVFGTRPEIVKLAPVIRLLGDRVTLIHTGQHYDDEMAGVFLRAFDLPDPSRVLRVGGETRGQQIGRATSELDILFRDLRPEIVVVQGDTNSTLAAALAANARSIPIAHVEAGLRSHDRAMPEEHNRVVTDHLADLCLAPTRVSRRNLEREGIAPERVVVTGNTVVDAVNQLLPTPEDRTALLDRFGLRREAFVLSTFHRPENVDDPERLETIVNELASLDMPVLLPVHPRTAAMADRFGFDLGTGDIRPTEPLGYVEFLGLLAECALAIADSGGLQEEVSVVKRPMVVVRNSTERPEVLGTFCQLLRADGGFSDVGRKWLAGDPSTLQDLAGLPSPYGSGHAGELSAAAIERFLTG